MGNDIKRTLLAATVAISSSVLPHVAHSQETQFLYSLHRGAPLSGGLTNHTKSIKITAGLNGGGNAFCGDFDIMDSVVHQLSEDVEGFFDNLMDDIVNGVAAYVAGLGAMAIQRADPALYDLMQNGTLQASAEFNYSKASCEEIVHAMTSQKDTKDYSDQAKGEEWESQAAEAGANSTDAIEAEDKVDKEAPEKGIKWVGGNRHGGAGQEPLRINTDSAVAGYNLLMDRGVTEFGPVGNCNEAALCEEWASSTEAAQWIVDVLGEKAIAICAECEKMSSTAGLGLRAKYQEEKVVAAEKLVEFVTGVSDMTEGALNEASQGTRVTLSRPLIEAIRAEGAGMMVVQKIASTMAVQKTIARTVMAIGVLRAGLKEPNIANNKAAQDDIRLSIADLRDELSLFNEEMEAYRNSDDGIAIRVMQRKDIRDRAKIGSGPQESNIQDGAVKQ